MGYLRHAACAAQKLARMGSYPHTASAVVVSGKMVCMGLSQDIAHVAAVPGKLTHIGLSQSTIRASIASVPINLVSAAGIAYCIPCITTRPCGLKMQDCPQVQPVL